MSFDIQRWMRILLAPARGAACTPSLLEASGLISADYNSSDIDMLMRDIEKDLDDADRQMRLTDKTTNTFDDCKP